MKQLNEIISGYEDYPGGPRSVRAQSRCRVAGNLRLHLNQKYREPDEPTLDLRNEMDFEREARERYEESQNTSPYQPIDYLARAKQYAVVLSESMAANINDRNTIQDSIDFMCQPVEPSDEVKAFLTAPELEVQKWEHEQQVLNWRKHQGEICRIVDHWMTSDELVGVEYPDDLPEILQKAVKAMFKGLRDARAKTLAGKFKGDRALTQEAYDAGFMDLTALQNSF